jgi:sugar lactone lactonase YvrE
VAIDVDGNVYLTNFYGPGISKYDQNGTSLAGWAAHGRDGEYVAVGGLAVDSSGNVWITDRANGRIQRFDSTGTLLDEWGGIGIFPYASRGMFDEPDGIALDVSGNVYVLDTGNARIRKFHCP